MVGKTWKVVGGSAAGGLIVRSGKDLKSPEVPGGRISTGSVLEELELQGQRLRFRKLTGYGPESGWLSLKLKDADLVVPCTARSFGTYANLQGAEVWMTTHGSRGDCQPFVALAVGLLKAGAKVRMFTSYDHEAFITSYGIQYTGVCQGQDFLKRSYMESLSEEEYEREAVHGMSLWQLRIKLTDKVVLTELADRKPDLILYNHAGHSMGLLAWEVFGVKALPVHVGYESFESFQEIWARYFCTMHNQELLVAEGVIPNPPPLSDLSFGAFCHYYTSCETICGTTALWSEAHSTPDARAAFGHLRPVGNMALTDTDEADDSIFGGADAARALRSFLASGSPPVYTGWGSVFPRNGIEAMTISVVAALRMNKRRGIFLGGWSGVGAAVFEKAIEQFDPSDPMNLRGYAKDNVLFVDAAPHEWLFPQCSATIHHGGAGTTAAALRAGVPTIIIACGYDQFLSADLVTKLGCGLRLDADERFTWQLLSKTLRTVTSDTMTARAKEIGEITRNEAGVLGALSMVDEAVYEVRSGATYQRWAKAWAEKCSEYQGLLEATQRKAPTWGRVLFSQFERLRQKVGEETDWFREHRPLPTLQFEIIDTSETFALDFNKPEAFDFHWGPAPKSDTVIKLADWLCQGILFDQDLYGHFSGIDQETYYNKIRGLFSPFAIRVDPDNWIGLADASLAARLAYLKMDKSATTSQ